MSCRTMPPSLPIRQVSAFLLLVMTSLACQLASVAIIAADSPAFKEAVECHSRGGLPNVRAKIEAGQSVKIAYLGGSITAAPGWRVLSREWLTKQYPGVPFEQIDAAIGGTGSDLGVFRLKNDVLRHGPDLLFVEFAVNDGGAPPEQIHKAMEGIVRQTWRANPTTDIVFVYTVSEPFLEQLRNGKMQRSASAMEDVAEHYKIPSIHLGVKVVQLEKDGELVFKAPRPADIREARPLVFSTDGVHPHVETGHEVYAATIARCWPAIMEASGKPADHALDQPLRTDNFERAQQIPITANMLKGAWKKLPADHTLARRFARNMPELYEAEAPGAALEFTIEGTTLAIFDLLGPDGGRLKIMWDDLPPTYQNRIDPYCTYHRMGKTTIASERPAGRHHVRIELMPEKLNKREILFEHNRKDYDDHPEKYADHKWIAGSILLIGDIVADEPDSSTSKAPE